MSAPPLIRGEQGLGLTPPDQGVVVRWIEASDATDKQLSDVIELLLTAFDGSPSSFEHGVPPVAGSRLCRADWRGQSGTPGSLAAPSRFSLVGTLLSAAQRPGFRVSSHVAVDSI